MKSIFLSLSICLLSVRLFAQVQPDTSVHSVELESVVVNGSAPDKAVRNVRPQNVYLIFNSSTDSKRNFSDSCFFLTRWPKVADLPVSVHSVDVRLKPFDTSLFDILLMVMQINNEDTFYRTILIDGSTIKSKKWSPIPLKAEGITLQPHDFYLGYSFRPKNIPERYRYRLLSSEKGEGVILSLRNNKMMITSVDAANFPYVFPFKVSYRKI